MRSGCAQSLRTQQQRRLAAGCEPCSLGGVHCCPARLSMQERPTSRQSLDEPRAGPRIRAKRPLFVQQSWLLPRHWNAIARGDSTTCLRYCTVPEVTVNGTRSISSTLIPPRVPVWALLLLESPEHHSNAGRGPIANTRRRHFLLGLSMSGQLGRRVVASARMAARPMPSPRRSSGIGDAS